MVARAGIMGLLLTLLSAAAFATTEAAAEAATRSAAQAATRSAAEAATRSAAQPVSLAAHAAADGAMLAAAAATVRQVDTSPSAPVVSRAPTAVSVTFSDRIAAVGFTLRIFGPDGEVSAAQAQVVGNAIRRPLDRNVPSGAFEVRWTAQSPAGQKLSGSFRFIAAGGHGDAEVSSEPAPQASATPAALVATPETTATHEAAGPAAETGAAAGTGALSAQLMVVPIALGAALVLASAVVGLISTSRRQVLVVHRGLALPWQRQQQ